MFTLHVIPVLVKLLAHNFFKYSVNQAVKMAVEVQQIIELVLCIILPPLAVFIHASDCNVSYHHTFSNGHQLTQLLSLRCTCSSASFCVSFSGKFIWILLKWSGFYPSIFFTTFLTEILVDFDLLRGEGVSLPV